MLKMINFSNLLCLTAFLLFEVWVCDSTESYAQTKQAKQDNLIKVAISPVGYWECVDLVKEKEDFAPGRKIWKDKINMESFACFENGRTTKTGWTWGKGLINAMETWSDEKEHTASAKYFIKTIDESTYLFLPYLQNLMSGRKDMYYYVLKKISDQPYCPVSFSDLPKIDRHPLVCDYGRAKLDSIPAFNTNSQAPFQVDLRSHDISGLDLKGSFENLLYASFDNKTVWPKDNLMPKELNTDLITELGKDPGLGVRTLHSKGITGRHVGIAIIDQPLFVDHPEYKDRLKLYEETEDIFIDLSSQMHGPAVASIAVGKTTGVAPEADLYFIATDYGGGKNSDYFYLARCIRRNFAN